MPIVSENVILHKGQILYNYITLNPVFAYDQEVHVNLNHT